MDGVSRKVIKLAKLVKTTSVVPGRGVKSKQKPRDGSALMMTTL